MLAILSHILYHYHFVKLSLYLALWKRYLHSVRPYKCDTYTGMVLVHVPMLILWASLSNVDYLSTCVHSHPVAW
jgi:hypothetical protein